MTLQHFSCGTRDQATLLKTFYSLQRADVVDLIGSRIVLKGAVDLVAENADDTLYSINRVGQLNLKESSTVKVTKTVNLLSELTSDEQPQRQFIDRGNNTGNAEVTGNNYTAHGGAAPAEPLTKEEEQQYIQAYESYAANGTLPTGSKFGSVNVVCVANGGYLEIKKSASAYGPVTGLFTLQLVNANPGEGGGFVYADIMGKQAGTDDADEKYVTGNFICVTKQSDSSNDYMYAYHDVGGQLASDGKYEYYLWYLRGNKYNYDVDLTAYIGTKDTDFSRTFSLSVEPDYTFVLRALQQSSSLQGIDPETLLKNTWTADEDAAGEQMAVEVTLLKNVKKGSGVEKTEEQIGFLGYETTDDTNPTAEAKKDAGGNLVWGLWRASDSDWKFQPCSGAGDTNSLPVTAGDALAQIDADVVNAQVKFTLHKGTGMTTEFRNLPFEMRILEVKQSDFDAAAKNNTYIQEDSCIRLTTNISLSAIRLVPTQAAYMGSGRMFAGVSSSSTVHVTKNSSFTAQFVTKYIPSAFNTGTSNQITETLVTGYTDIYLLDENGVGYTIAEGEDGTITLLNRVNTSDPNVKSYQIGKTEDGGYQVSYCGEDGTVLTDDDGKQRIYDCTVKTQSSGFTLPKGTVITLLASLDEDNPTYWYYYCTDATNEVKLEDFRQMNHGAADMGSSVYDTVFTTSSSRVTENMIFVFDFSNVTAADWNGELNGHVMLRHTYNSGTFQGDIMDYVSADAESTDEETAVSYTREIPKATEEFRISDGSDGVAQFTIANTDENISYGQKAQIHFMLNTVPDTTVTNTQYEEREYAVILSLQKSGDNADIPFPEGTTFLYQGQQLIVGTDNKSVIVPVGTVGKHEVELDAGLAGFAPGEYQLTAKLYATSAEGYYNSIPVGNNQGDITTSAFTIMQDPVYALKVIENSDRTKNHFAQTGESFAFAVTASGGAVSDAVDVQLYRYEKKQYVPVSTSAVLQGAPNLQTAQSGSWHPVVKDDAAKGTYRLAFTYHDKTEYWDFMITK